MLTLRWRDKLYMKKYSLFVLCVAALLAVGCGLSAALSEAEKETQELVESYVENHELFISVDTIIPHRGSPIHTFDGYFLKIKDGEANSYLPFFGESYVSMYGGVDKPEIEYKDCPVQVYESVNSRGKHTWAFTGKSNGVDVTTTIEFFSSGYATITCTSPKRSMMRYKGTITEDTLMNDAK